MPTASTTASAPRPCGARAHLLADVVDLVEVDHLGTTRLRRGPAARAPGRRRSPGGPGAARSGSPCRRSGRGRARAGCRPRARRRRRPTARRWAARRRGTGSARPAAPRGTLIGMNWACGTRRYSACAPGTSPYSLLKPNSAAPMPWSRTWVVSHCVCSPWVHIQQWPQQIWNGITTRSPTCRSPRLGADLLDDAHRLVTEDVALAHERAERLVEVQVRAAEAARGDPHDRVVGFLRGSGPGPPPPGRLVDRARSLPSSRTPSSSGPSWAYPSPGDVCEVGDAEGSSWPHGQDTAPSS